jgi:hypothetical protein
MALAYSHGMQANKIFKLSLDKDTNTSYIDIMLNTTIQYFKTLLDRIIEDARYIDNMEHLFDLRRNSIRSDFSMDCN